MGAFYEIRVFDTLNNAQGIISRFASLRYVLRENAIGSLVLNTPDKALFDAISADWRLEVWRSIDGGAPYLEGSGAEGTIWFVVTKTLATDAQGLTLMTIEAQDAKALLARRIVDFPSGSAQASKNAALDNMAKAIVREQLGGAPYGGAQAQGRDLITAGLLTVQADTSVLPVKRKSFAWRNVLLVLQDLVVAMNDTGNGNHFAFDIVKGSGAALEFRTYPDCRGIHRNYYLTDGTVNPNLLIVSDANGSFTEPTLIYDWSAEINYVRAGGEGEGAARITAQSIDPRRVLVSPYNRRERFVDARNGGADAGELQTEAIIEILNSRPRQRMTGRVVESPTVRYGVQYRHGDIVTAVAFGVRFDCRVITVSVTLDVNGETIEAQLAGDRVVDYTI